MRKDSEQCTRIQVGGWLAGWQPHLHHICQKDSELIGFIANGLQHIVIRRSELLDSVVRQQGGRTSSSLLAALTEMAEDGEGIPLQYLL